MSRNVPPEIIRATTEHVEQLAPLFDAYRVFYEQETDLEAARNYLLARLRHEESVIFLAWESQTKDGWGFIQMYPSFSSISLQRTWILYDLFVQPHKRRQGVGRALMEYAHRFARESGARTVSLSTAIDNIPGQRLYESLGYIRDQAFYYYDLRL